MMVLHRTVTARKLAKWEKPRKKITGKMVRPSAKVKTSTDVNHGKWQNMCGFLFKQLFKVYSH